MRKICPIILLILLVPCTIVSAKPKSKPKFPASTILCGIMSQDRFSKVKKLYGLNAKPVNMSVSAEAETYTLIYNDPKFDAHILIDSGEGISVSKVGLSFDGKIYGGVALMTGRIKGKHFASKSFARMGNYYGITLGDSIEKIKHYYPKAKVFPEKNGDLWITTDLPSPPDWSCNQTFTLRKGKIIKIFSGFIP